MAAGQPDSAREQGAREQGAGDSDPADADRDGAIDIHSTAGKLADLERRLDQAVHAGSARAIERQHARGKLTARERIELLLDEGSFVELDEFARHRSTTSASTATAPTATAW